MFTICFSENISNTCSCCAADLAVVKCQYYCHLSHAAMSIYPWVGRHALMIRE